MNIEARKEDFKTYLSTIKVSKITVYLNRELMYKEEACESLTVDEITDTFFKAASKTKGGEFYCKIYKSKSGNAEPYIYRFDLDFGHHPFPGSSVPGYNAPVVDESAIIARVKKEMLLEAKDVEFKEREKELNEKEKALESISGKFYVILERIGIQLLEKHSGTIERVLNGFVSPAQKTSLNLHRNMPENQTVTKEFTQSEIDSINSSLGKIMNVFSPEEFSRLAEYVEKNPTQKSLILSFI